MMRIGILWALTLAAFWMAGCDSDDGEAATADASVADAQSPMGQKPNQPREEWDMAPLPAPDRMRGARDGGPGDAGALSLVPPECAVETVRLDGFEIFAYEASRTDGSEAAEGTATDQVCSRPGARPWTHVTIADAAAGCELAGFRLCTDAEWEAACRGEDGRQFPYGRLHEPGRCNDHVSGASEVRPSGHYSRCHTETGIYDLSGNVWEITADPSRRGASHRVYASSFRAEAGDCISTYVLFDDYHEDDLGFRCCRSLE